MSKCVKESKKKKSSENSAIMGLLETVFEAKVFDTSLALVLVKFSEFDLALFSLAHQRFFLIFFKVPLAIHRFMNLKVFIDAQVGVHSEDFGAEGAFKDFFGDFLMVGAVMRFDGVMIAAEDLGAVFAADGKPVLLLAGVN